MSTTKRDGRFLKRKASDEELIRLYKIHESVKAVAKEVGMCGQSVHERLVKLGVNKNVRILTEKEKSLIKALYTEGFKRGDGKLKSLAKEINRTVPFISRYAKSQELTMPSRGIDQSLIDSLAEQVRDYIDKNGHPRGNLGNKHSKSTIERISEKSKEHWASLSQEEKELFVFDRALKNRLKTNIPERKKVTWRGGWREIAGRRIYFRSSWEANYARFLQRRKDQGLVISWEYEPEVFVFKPGQTKGATYTPDFKVYTGYGEEYHEVKGWMDERSISKLSAMQKYYPNIVLVLINSKFYGKIKSHYQNIIPGWE